MDEDLYQLQSIIYLYHFKIINKIECGWIHSHINQLRTENELCFIFLLFVLI